MVKALVVGIGAAVLMTGCAGGINDDGTSPSVTYTVPRSYQIVYLRVQNQADECLRGKKQYDVYAQINPDLQSGSVTVKGPLGGLEVARTDIQAVDKSHTKVTHTVWGHKPWDDAALRAMRQSVLLDTSVCVAYK
ncbi:BPTD_2524 family lipoprotein [Allopusillimonas ginsengisoli]|uniref:BPTD_2524 family lipoprotein n=1 Tax=Allopusillimonas ginsengisoli TaxID=453575 RepID=UPI0010202255|nr:hypothetical protein [Allopusillimonas ginsengisoli]TEA71872.1 hypothetical protein ERE07_20220 [Allopusillimonas ginsengisoli]